MGVKFTSSRAEKAALIHVKGTLGPATANYIIRSIKQAAKDNPNA